MQKKFFEILVQAALVMRGFWTIQKTTITVLNYTVASYYILWHFRLWSFKTRDTKLERFLHKNQLTQRKLLNFENWTDGEYGNTSCGVFISGVQN